jgi:hypothetical protein
MVRMKKEWTHYSRKEKEEILTPYIGKSEAEQISKDFETYTFAMLKNLSEALRIIAKGKLKN